MLDNAITHVQLPATPMCQFASIVFVVVECCAAGVSPPAGEWPCWSTRGEGPPDHRPLTTPSRPCLVRFENRSAFEAPRTVIRGAAGEVVVWKNLCPAPDHDGLTKCSERERIYRSTGGGQDSTGRSADLRASIPGERITKSPCDRRRHCISPRRAVAVAGDFSGGREQW